MRQVDEQLFDGCARADFSGIEKALADGADPNVASEPYGTTPLYGACFRDQPTVIAFLLERGANPNQRILYRSPVDGRVEDGIVALMLCRSVEAVDALLLSGADPNITDTAGNSPLMRVALSAPLAAVERLLAAGADPSKKDALGRIAADLVRARLGWLDENGTTATRRRSALERILTLIESSIPERLSNKRMQLTRSAMANGRRGPRS